MQTLMEWDPFKLKQDNEKYKKYVMYTLYVAVCILVLGLLLYVLLGIFTERRTRVSHYRKRIRTWNKLREDQTLDTISVAAKIMPSENTRDNMIIMERRKDAQLDEQKINRKYNYSQSYFYHANTTLYFPTFRFEPGTIPVGNSEVYCVHLLWTPIENELNFESSESLKGFPECRKARNPRIVWHQHDPTTGAEVFVWQQKATPLTGCRTRESCEKICNKSQGITKANYDKTFTCYTYKVLSEICLMMYYNGSDSWVFAGGCFENGSPVKMVSAVPGETYTFEDIRLQVRSVHDPYIVATFESHEDEEISLGKDVDFLDSLAFFLLVLAIILGILIAAAVLLKERIYQTQIFKKWFCTPYANHSGESSSDSPPTPKETKKETSKEEETNKGQDYSFPPL